MNKKITKIFISFLLVFSLMISVSISAFAEDKKDTAKKTISYLDKKFNLKKIDKMPEGLIPLRFDTVEEAEKYLDSFHSNIEQLKINNVINTAEISPMTIGSQTASNWAGALLWVNTTAQYTYSWNSSQSRNLFTAVNAVTSMGVAYGPGLAWTPDSSQHYGNISSDGTRLFVHSGGLAEIFVFVQGIGRVLSEYETFDNTFGL